MLKAKNLPRGVLVVILTIIVTMAAVPIAVADVTWSPEAEDYRDNYLGRPSYCIFAQSGMPAPFFQAAYEIVVANAISHATGDDGRVDVFDLEWAQADYMVVVMGLLPTMEDAYAAIVGWEVACGWPVHDVGVLNVSAARTVDPGHNVTIDVQVENHGNFTESFSVTAYYDGKAIGTKGVTNLDPGVQQTLTFTWNTIGVPSSSTYTISATASVVPNEINTVDNSLIDGLVIILGPGVDVAVWSVMADSAEVFPGNVVEVTVDVINEALQGLTTNVTAKYNNSTISTQPVSLASGALTTLTYLWNTSMVPLGTYTISAEATQLIGETDLADNSKTDGTVTIYTRPPAVPETAKIEYAFIATGTWYQIGYEVGSYFSEEIISTAEELVEMLNVSRAMDYYEQIKGMISPDVIEQMEGKAQGLSDSAHIDYSTAWGYILVLDLLVDLLYLPVECTVWGVVSEDGSYLCHQTDGPYSRAGEPPYYRIIHKPRDANGHKIGHDFVGLTSHFVGVMLGENDAGLAIAYNMVVQKNATVGLPVTFMIRTVLYECETFDQAVQRIQGLLEIEGNSYGAQGVNLLLMDFKTDRLARIEIASTKVTVTEPTGYPKWIAATNHYISQPEENMPDYQSSFIRYNRTLHLLENATNRDYNYMCRMLSDHGPTGDPKNPSHGDANTICRHVSDEDGSFQSDIYTTNGTRYYSIFNPCFYGGKLQSFNWLQPFRVDSHYVRILSNSTIIGFCDLNFTVNGEDSQIGFNVSGPEGTAGYCEVSIPKDLMQGSFQVSIDGSKLRPETQSNATHTILYFFYDRSVHTIVIASRPRGEIIKPIHILAIVALSLSILAVAIAIIYVKRKRSSKRNRL